MVIISSFLLCLVKYYKHISNSINIKEYLKYTELANWNINSTINIVIRNRNDVLYNFDCL